jgi:hypothetical protein
VATTTPSSQAQLNRSWYQRNTGRQIRDVQRRVRHSAIPWMAATLDGIVEGAVFEAKFMLPWSFSQEAAAEKYMAQVQHNMWVTHLRTSVLSIITVGGKWVEMTIPMDPLYLSVLVSAEKKFWRCVQSGEPPHLINVQPPRPRMEAIRIVDMSSSNSWAEFAGLFRNTRQAFLKHERAKSELKSLMPEDAKEAVGHGVRAKRSRSGMVAAKEKIEIAAAIGIERRDRIPLHIGRASPTPWGDMTSGLHNVPASLCSSICGGSWMMSASSNGHWCVCHLQVSQIRGRQPYLFVRKILYVIASRSAARGTLLRSPRPTVPRAR